MTHQEKQRLWGRYPEVWEMFVEFNGITKEDDEAWGRLIDRAHQIMGTYDLPVVMELLITTVDDLENISKKRRGCG